MFVIMQCFSNLSDQQKSTLPLPEQIGQAMRHAGVAISITSLTDICAFGVGAVTVSSLECGVGHGFSEFSFRHLTMLRALTV